MKTHKQSSGIGKYLKLRNEIATGEWHKLYYKNKGMNMIICCKCQKEMRCDKNGIGADFGNGHVYVADRYICKTCGNLVLSTNRTAMFDPDYKYQSEYLTMKKQD